MPDITVLQSKPKIAISACLMGAEVRYNGGHKESRLCSRVLSEYFDFVAVCPEVAIGLGTPASQSAWSAIHSSRKPSAPLTARST